MQDCSEQNTVNQLAHDCTMHRFAKLGRDAKCTYRQAVGRYRLRRQCNTC